MNILSSLPGDLIVLHSTHTGCAQNFEGSVSSVLKDIGDEKNLLPTSKVPTDVITNVIIIFNQTVWLVHYLDLFLLYFQILPAILKNFLVT